MLVYLAILMPVLLLCCGIGIDVELLQLRKQQMQSASDAAAMGAALQLEAGASNWISAGQSDAATNGFTNGSGSTVVAVQKAPTTGSYTGALDAVQATITQTQPTIFLKLLSNNTATIKTKSVAIVTPCMYIMGGSSGNDLTTTSSTVNSPNCPYYINNSASVDANTSFSALAEELTGASGSSTWNGSSSAPPRYLAQTLTDPLASIVQPTVPSGCSNSNTTFTWNTNTTISAGYSCGTTTINCDNRNTNVVVSFNPGLYRFGGSFTINNCILSGTGVTLYFTSSSTGSWGGFTLNTCTVNLSAPTTTSTTGIAGVLIMNDRGWQRVTTQDFVLNNSNVRGDGIWYLTGAGLAVKDGTIIGTNYSGVVVDNLYLKNATFTSANNYASLPGGNPFRPLGGLVE